MKKIFLAIAVISAVSFASCTKTTTVEEAPATECTDEACNEEACTEEAPATEEEAVVAEGEEVVEAPAAEEATAE